ncbi:hypothetical protein [Bacillus pumilus]|uniref:hypothetical protein n=1 Tax=Bacillus pumilus TaxID=1408 RepID=UPI003306049B
MTVYLNDYKKEPKEILGKPDSEKVLEYRIVLQGHNYLVSVELDNENVPLITLYELDDNTIKCVGDSGENLFLLFNKMEITDNELINHCNEWLFKTLERMSAKEFEMGQIDIANELLKNTQNKYIKQFISEHISNYSLESIDLVRFHKCITYIQKQGFDIKGWELFEIPMPDIYCFYNAKTRQSFDLTIMNDLQVHSQFIDETGNGQIALSIHQAIQLDRRS